MAWFYFSFGFILGFVIAIAILFLMSLLKSANLGDEQIQCAEESY